MGEGGGWLDQWAGWVGGNKGGGEEGVGVKGAWPTRKDSSRRPQVLTTPVTLATLAYHFDSCRKGKDECVVKGASGQGVLPLLILGMEIFTIVSSWQ